MDWDPESSVQEACSVSVNCLLGFGRSEWQVLLEKVEVEVKRSPRRNSVTDAAHVMSAISAIESCRITAWGMGANCDSIPSSLRSSSPQESKGMC